MIPEQIPVNNHYGNNEATQFDFDFFIENEEQITVTHTDFKGNQTYPVRGVDYSIKSVGQKDGSYIVFPLADSKYNVLGWDLTTGQKELLTIALNIPIEQPAEYQMSTKLSLKNIEGSFDYLTRICQILARQLERTVKVKEGSAATPDELITSLNQAQINAKNSAIEASSYANISETNAELAKNWATKTDGMVDDTDYSSKYYAIKAKNQADTAVRKTQEVTETYNNAMADIQADWQDAVDDIESKYTQSITNIQNATDYVTEKLKGLHYPVFCFNSGLVDEQGQSTLCSLENDILTQHAPCVCTTSDGQTYIISEDVTLDISEFPDGNYNVFYFPETKEMKAYANTIYIQDCQPAWSENDIWVDTSVMPYITKQNILGVVQIVKCVQNSSLAMVWGGRSLMPIAYNKDLVDKNILHGYAPNRILKNPTKIKADIVDGTLTVYAGSICIVPYGTDAPTYSVGDFLLGEANNNLYKIVDIQYDANIDYPVLDQPLLFYTVEVQRDISTDWVPPNATEAVVRSMYLKISGEESSEWVYGEITPHCTSGTTNSNTTGHSLFYNTSANTCQRLNTSQTPTQSVCSLPILQVNYSLDNPKLSSILNIFDCLGFIGSTAYFYKNISMLMGIDKNPDGSQKNIEYTTDKLYLHTISPTVANYFYYVGFENGVSIDPNSKKLIFDNPNTTFVGSSSLGTFINQWKMWNFRTGKWEFYSSAMNDGVPFQVYNAIFGRLWFEDGKIIRLSLNPTGMLRTDEEKGITTNEQDSLSAMSVAVSGTNLNSFRKAGTYYFSSSHTPTNIPAGVNGVLQVITNNERTVVKQIWFRQGTIKSNDTQTWIRTYGLTNTETNTYGWSDWQQLIPQFKKANPGFLKSGGMIVQGGSYTMSSNNGDKVITFPTAFSNTSYCIIAKRMGSDDNDYESGATASRTTTSCKIHSWGGYTYSWIAFGY